MRKKQPFIRCCPRARPEQFIVYIARIALWRLREQTFAMEPQARSLSAWLRAVVRVPWILRRYPDGNLRSSDSALALPEPPPVRALEPPPERAPERATPSRMLPTDAAENVPLPLFL